MAVSSSQLGSARKQDVGPQLSNPATGTLGDPVADLLMAQLADPSLNPASAPWGTATLEPTTGFRFRSKPGNRLIQITIPVPVPMDDDVAMAKQHKVYARMFKGREQELNDLTELAADLGTRVISFKEVPGKFECHLDTDDPRVAAYVRGSGPFREGRIYEELAPMTVTVNGQTINVMPADDAARQTLASLSGAA